jgi:hypothetical protein
VYWPNSSLSLSMWNARAMARIVATYGLRVHPVVMIRKHCMNGRPRVFGIKGCDALAAAATGYSILCEDQLAIL